ncbi:MAG: hypothetical protein ACK5YR_02680 [Pirellula sp.]|jgi:hypothetical protein
MKTYSTAAFRSRPVTPVGSIKILNSVLSKLANNGFVIVERRNDSAIVTGPGLRSTRQNPLLGATRIQIAVDDNQVRLNAELGGVASMQKFVLLFPFALGFALSVFFAVAGGWFFGKQFGIGFGVPWAKGWSWFMIAIGIGMLPAFPWLLISPWMAKLIRNNTHQALDDLVSNSIQMESDT